MRAVVVAGGALEIVERPTPSPVADQVLVEIAGTGINRADLMQRDGAYPAPSGWPPDVPGLEFSGTVAEIGPSVGSLRPGDRVFGIVGGGGHASHLITTEQLCVPIPPGLDPVEAGGVPEVFITAHDALVTLAGVRSGERVLIHAVAGGVGTAAVQIAAAIGASTIGTSRTAPKLERMKELGLDRAVVVDDPNDPSVAEAIGEVDVVLELVGGPYVELDVRACSPTGRIVLVGLMAGATAEADLGLILRKRLTIVGTVLRTRPEYEKAAATAAFAREIVPLLERGTLRPVVDRAVPLEDAREAYDYVGRDEPFGKVILVP